MLPNPRVRAESKTGARVRVFINKTLVCDEDANDLEIEVLDPVDFLTADRVTLRTHGNVRNLSAVACTINKQARKPPATPSESSSSSSGGGKQEEEDEDNDEDEDEDEMSYAPDDGDDDEGRHARDEDSEASNSRGTPKRRKVIVISDDDEEA